MSSALYMSHFPNFSLEGDQDQGPTLTLANDPSLIYPFVIDNSRDLEARVEHHDQREVLYPFLMNNSDDQERRVRDHDQKEINEHIFLAGSRTTSASASIPSIHGIMTDNKSDQQSLSGQFVTNHEFSQGQGQWMSSKVRIMRKMMDSGRSTEKKPKRTAAEANQQDQTTSDFNNNNPSNGIIRVCSACNTTKTPLWRSGPCGPKSLCNACGIRQRKARRSALAAANGGLVPIPAQTYKVKKDKRSADIDRTLPIKKRCKINTNNVVSKQITAKDEVIIRLSKNFAFHRAFPQDETDAAILLMALSCSLVHS
ncbi:GATA transcription factor 15 [Rhynchospora pubera]|uniref:GATA transcription factor 15 n=1 Tax=Rhynchospora pubera TaxID=906938 RepID=A0AAV8GSR2_9POAL|nr:GATA transcription factor 15 [Rhynchospora pubera]